MSPFELSDHAVEQFVTRYDRSLTQEDGRLLLETVLQDERVTRLPDRTHTGEEQWHVPSLGVLLVTRSIQKGVKMVVTVIQETRSHTIRTQQQYDLLSAIPDDIDLDQYLKTHPVNVKTRMKSAHGAAYMAKPKKTKLVLEVEYQLDGADGDCTEEIAARVQRLFSNPVNFKGGSIKTVQIKANG